MEPLILKFKEVPCNQEIDYSILEYSEKLNLSVLRESKQPAIDYLSMETETFTRTLNEVSDSDKSELQRKLSTLVDTATHTYTQLEATDADPSSYVFKNLFMITDTTTLTEAVEGSDSDK